MEDTDSAARQSLGQLILAPALISLAVTIFRLAGELAHWSRGCSREASSPSWHVSSSGPRVEVRTRIRERKAYLTLILFRGPPTSKAMSAALARFSISVENRLLAAHGTQCPIDALGIARDDGEVGFSRVVGLRAALFPIPHSSKRDSEAGGKFLLGRREGAAKCFDTLAGVDSELRSPGPPRCHRGG